MRHTANIHSRFICCMILLIGAAGTANAAWQVEVVDSSGRVGSFCSIAIDHNTDLPHISYYDESNGNLKYAFHNGSNWETQTVDSSADVGTDSVLALDAGGLPHITYYDFTNYALKYAFFDGASWQIAVISGSGFSGEPSIAIDSSDRPHISYCNYDTKELVYAFYDRGWNVQALASGSQVGFSSLALDDKNRPHICYYNYDSTDLRYFYKSGGWFTEIVDNSDNVGLYASIALDSTEAPHIAYYDVENGDLKYYHGGDGIHVIDIVDSTGWTGLYTSIAIDFDDNPHISYCDDSNGDLRYAYYDGLQWQRALVDADGFVGYYSSLALDSNDTPHIAYLDESSGRLKYAVAVGSAITTSVATSSTTTVSGGSTTTSTAGATDTTTTVAGGGAETTTTTTPVSGGSSTTTSIPYSFDPETDELAITSTPVTAATVGRTYHYLLTTNAADSTLTFALIRRPDGMQVDTKGYITWEPAITQLGTHTVEAAARHGDAEAHQTFTIETRLFSAGAPPQTSTTTSVPTTGAAPPPVPVAILSSPAQTAVIGNLYCYALGVQSYDGIASCELIEAPKGMTISSPKGVITWQPGLFQWGNHLVIVKITTRSGYVASQQFSLRVSLFGDSSGRQATTTTSADQAAGASITIISTPLSHAVVGNLYYYAVEADCDNPVGLRFSLIDSPEGMTVSETKGVIAWLPRLSDIGTHSVAVQAENSNGDTARQQFALKVSLLPPKDR